MVIKKIRIAICDDDSIGRGLLQESLEYLLQEITCRLRSAVTAVVRSCYRHRTDMIFCF